jgi:DNA repair photolyase
MESINVNPSGVNPPNRFERIAVEEDFEQLGDEVDDLARRPGIRTEYFVDDSKTIVAENDSPDVRYHFTLNPYRGCAHGCPYCYARPSHEYLGWSAGLDFETKVLVKLRAAELFREWLARDQWQPESIGFSGVTDCYQPAERHFRLTRGCLEVALEACQPVTIITKNALVARDLDLLRTMAEQNLVQVHMSITTLERDLARAMEPRTSTPEARLRTIRELSDAGVNTGVMVAPIIPGLNDREIPGILREAADAGARTAGYILLRLPGNVRPVFLDWLARTQPQHQERIVSRIRATREGPLNDSQFCRRMRGVGPIAEQIADMMAVFSHKHGLDTEPPPLNISAFRRPRPISGQLPLF